MPDFVVASTTATQEEIEKAVSPDWRTPIPVKEEPAKEVASEEIPVTSEEEVETAPDSEPEIKQEEEKPVKGKGGFQKKIDKLTKEKTEEKARADTLAQELAAFKERFDALEQRLAKPAETKEEKQEAKTTSDSKDEKPTDAMIGTKYKDWDEKNDALIAWTARQLLKETLAERDQRARTDQEREDQETRETGYRQAAKEFVKTTPDFNDAINAAAKAGMKLPVPILERIQELPNGPQVTYYLVTNPDEALALVEADPVDGFIMLGRISYGLETQAKAEVKPPVKKAVSTAPAAVKPVTGGSVKLGNSLQEISARSNDEYIRVRRAQLAAK
jgi:hypothetical protein